MAVTRPVRLDPRVDPGRIESPVDKLLRSTEPWSSYVVLPIFALANAGVVRSLGVFTTHTWLLLAIIFGLLIGKPLGIFPGSWLPVRRRSRFSSPLWLRL
ncbi:MAG TPA: Na+/H+ antiporter NhaA [Candidatus Udaeobacter sp.]|jgi:NhaA family Na+:H+ antiporter|nr:Na+/H+ antiporter NhaA [Candidatus Udaeobacter sp.]